MSKRSQFLVLFGTWIAVSWLFAPPAVAQTGATTGIAGTNSAFVNPFPLQDHRFVCGGISQAGTPIAGNANGADGAPGGGDDGTSGVITISAIPATAQVVGAKLYWTVLTNDAEASSTGGSILFNGAGVTGTKIGTAATTPCFSQTNTIAWTADVTALVPSPGNGSYTVSSFPGGNALAGPNFTEGVTLQILWGDPFSSTVREAALYHLNAGTGGLPVTTLPGDTFSQSVDSFVAAAPGNGRLFPVIGNGQSNATETYSVAGSGPPINLNNTLDGSTTAKAAGTCSYTDNGTTECYWDDDVVPLDTTLNGGDTSVTMSYATVTDCHDFVAVSVAVDASSDRVCQQCGVFVDAQCPPDGEYNNHGDYVSCVAHAAEACLAGLPTGGSCPREDIQSCGVSARAKTDIGKK